MHRRQQTYIFVHLKKFLAIALASLGLTALVFSDSNTKPISKKFNPKGKKIAFIGDSMTAGYGWGWQSVMAKIYGFIEVNLAVGGKRTDWMLTTLTRYLTTDSCDAVFIYGGANDAYSAVTNASAIANVQKMVDLCVSKNILAYVVLGYDPMIVSYGRVKPTRYVPTQVGMNDLTKKYAKQQILASKSIKNAKIIPVWKNCSQLDASDGLHLTASAQKRFAEYVGKEAFGG
jgi:lysophospholipase L1-like esterase